MENSPILLERLFNATPAKLWNALTDINEMKKWYFDLPEFKAEIGFKFQFSGGPSPEKEYIHLCEITEMIPEKKLSYSWSYLGYSGISYVSFELFEQENKTLLRLTHRGIESFPNENLDFAIRNFKEGWNHIINTSLSAYLKSIEQ